jgi:hypothetical protein
MKNILIGSRALARFGYGSIKSSTDYDVVSSEPIDDKFEFHDRWLLNNEDLDYYTSDSNTIEVNGHKLYIINPVGLALIKRSHLWRTIGFSKHITHWHRYLKGYEWDFSDRDLSFLKWRTTMTKEIYPEFTPDLKMSVDSFFDDAVTKKYNHDYLHELAAFGDVPMYTKLQKGGTSVMCYPSLWEALTYEEKLMCAAEETYVIAIERFLVPNEWDYFSKLAYIKALEKVCTTLSSGKFRDFCIDNYPSIINKFNQSKIEHICAKLRA